MDGEVELAVEWLRGVARRVSEWTLSSEPISTSKKKLLMDRLDIRKSLMMQRSSKRELLKRISRDKDIYGKIQKSKHIPAGTKPDSNTHKTTASRALTFSSAETKPDGGFITEFENELFYESSVLIGNQHQAQIPAMPDFLNNQNLPDSSQNSSETHDSDTKAGQLISKPSDSDSLRPDLQIFHHDCKCFDKGSMDCVRLHVEEANAYLKEKLGPAYYAWDFHLMGEKYADTWTRNEEEEFLSIVRMYPRSKGHNFWNHLIKDSGNRHVKFLTQKSRKDLVNYYFNVFVLRRRAAQNRLVMDTNSDDDETLLFELEEREELNAVHTEHLISDEMDVDVGSHETGDTNEVEVVVNTANGSMISPHNGNDVVVFSDEIHVLSGEDDSYDWNETNEGTHHPKKKRKVEKEDSDVVIVDDSGDDEEGEEKNDGGDDNDDDVNEATKRADMTNRAREIAKSCEIQNRNGTLKMSNAAAAIANNSHANDDIVHVRDNDVRDKEERIKNGNAHDNCNPPDTINNSNSRTNMGQDDDRERKTADQDSFANFFLEDKANNLVEDFMAHTEKSFLSSKQDLLELNIIENTLHHTPTELCSNVKAEELDNFDDGIPFPCSNILDDLLSVVDLDEFEGTFTN